MVDKDAIAVVIRFVPRTVAPQAKQTLGSA